MCTSRDWPAACLASSDDPGAAIATFFRKIVGEAQTTLIVAEALASAGVDLAHSAADTKAAFNRVLERLLRRAQQAGAVRADIALGELVALIVGVSRAVHHLGHDPALQLLTTPGAAFGAQSALFAEPNER